MIDRGQAQGYKLDFCLTCSKGGELASIIGISVQVCQALTAPEVLENIQLYHIEDAADDERSYDFNTMFGNDDSTSCPLTCEILQDDCSTALGSEFITLTENS